MKRLGNWKQSHTNRAIYPLDPRPEDVDIEDIAHALSMEVRYGGHSPFPMSVAQHSVFVSRRVEQLARGRNDSRLLVVELSRAALLHDAHEAYLKDIPSPLKAHLRVAVTDEDGHTWEQSYKELEQRWDVAIATELSVAIAFDHPLVKQADAELLATEADRFFPVRPQPWHPMPAPLDIADLREWHWTNAKDQFLCRWAELSEDFA